MLKKKPDIERHKKDAEAQMAARVGLLQAEGMSDAQIQRDAKVRHFKGKIRQTRYQLTEIVKLEKMLAQRAEAKAEKRSERKPDQPKKKAKPDPAKKKAKQERKMAVTEADA